MESKKILEKYVGPSLVSRILFWGLLALAALQLVLGVTGGSSADLWIVTAIMTLAMWSVFAVTFLLATSRLNKCVKRLEALGELDSAAKALENAVGAVVIGKNKGRISGGYLFGKNTGMVVRVKDLMWCYKFVQRVYFIPTNASLMVNTMDHTRIPAVIYGKNDKNQELEQAMLYLHKENPDILLGFNRENEKAYKAAKKAARV